MLNASKKRIARNVIFICATFCIILSGWFWYEWQSILHDPRNLPTNAVLRGLAEYKQIYKTYPPVFSALGGDIPCSASASAACLIDPVLASGTKSGYIYRYKAVALTATGQLDGFTLNIDPIDDQRADKRHYFLDQTTVTRIEIGRQATAASQPAN